MAHHLHHAYVHEGSLGELEALFAQARTRFGFDEAHGPDVHIRSFEKFGIAESRWLAGVAALRPAGGRALFVIGASSITSEAQQALLKLLEEPQRGVVFVFLLPHGVLLPTVRSRVLLWEGQQVPAQPPHNDISAFLKASGKERSDRIARMLKDDEGLAERVRDFLNGLEAALAPRLRTDPKARAALADIALARDYLGDRSPSLKLLLEHVALALPVL